MNKQIKRAALSTAAILLSFSFCIVQVSDSFAAGTDVSTWTNFVTAFATATSGTTKTINVTADITAGSVPLMTVGSNRRIIVNGNGHTIRRGSSLTSALLSVGASDTITINNLKFSGNSTGWSAIINRGNDFPTITFTGSVTNKTTVTRPILNLGTLTINNSSFENFATNLAGGVIHNGSSSTTSASLTISNSTFRHNYSDSNGGAIFAESGSASISGCTFENNYASSGGAIRAASNAAVTVTNSTFQNNFASTGGGGAIDSSNDSSKRLRVTGGHFTNNFAVQNGGAINSSNSTLNITGSEFSLNVSTGSGGAVYNINGSKSTSSISNGTFTDNYAKQNGGAVFASGLAMSGATVTDNIALQNGGGIYINQNTDITDSEILRNSAAQRGGGIYASRGTAISGTTISDNTATSAGGAYFNSVGTVGTNSSLTNTTITQNEAFGEDDSSADGLGGGILVERNTPATWALSYDSETQIYNNSAAAAGDDVLLSDENNSLNTLSVLPPTVDELVWYVDNTDDRYGNPAYTLADEDLESRSYVRSADVDRQTLGLKLAPVLPEYHITDGADQTIQIDKDEMQPVRADGDIAKFVELQIDDEVVDESNYELTSGSTIVTLAPAYVSSLATGDHTMTFVYTDGSVSTSFTITHAAEPLPINPETLDNIGIIITILALAVVCFVALSRRRARR